MCNVWIESRHSIKGVKRVLKPRVPKQSTQSMYWSFTYNNYKVALPTVQRRLRTAREALLQQSLADNECHRAGKRITELDRQGEEGRDGNNRQSKKNTKTTMRYRQHTSQGKFDDSSYRAQRIRWCAGVTKCV